MSFWGELVSALLGGDSPSSSSTKRSRRESSSTNRGSSYSPGDLLSGKVEFVAGKFAIVVSGDFKALVPLREMSESHVSDPTDILSKGQSVEFVLLQNDARGWTASLAAVPEARAREALAELEEGDLIKGHVAELKDRGVLVDVVGFQAWVPISELAWRWVDHPSEVVSIGDEVELKLTRIEMPEGWLTDKRKRRAKAVASLRACTPEPESPEIPVAFSGMPFKVWAVPKTPRNCDAVTTFVLEEIAGGQSRDSIAETTGLNLATLENIHTFLADESLANNWSATDRGRDLVEAIASARELNDDPIRGLFASAAPQAAQLLSLHEHHKQQPYPRGWPRPPFHKPAEDDFAKATDEALPEPLIEKLVPEDKRSGLARLQEDSRLRIFLRRDGGRPWKPVFIETSEYWLLAGLWSSFRPFFGEPYRPANGSERCQNFVMVRCLVVRAKQEDAPSEIVYFEPNTETLWCLNEERKVREKRLRGDVFPALPTPVHKDGESGSDQAEWQLQPDSWCSVRVF